MNDSLANASNKRKHFLKFSNNFNARDIFSRSYDRENITRLHKISQIQHRKYIEENLKGYWNTKENNPLTMGVWLY